MGSIILIAQNRNLTCSERHLKWPCFGGKSPLFTIFWKKLSKWVVFHHYWRFYEKSIKTDGFPPVLTVFSKNHGWPKKHGFWNLPSNLPSKNLKFRSIETIENERLSFRAVSMKFRVWSLSHLLTKAYRGVLISGRGVI